MCVCMQVYVGANVDITLKVANFSYVRTVYELSMPAVVTDCTYVGRNSCNQTTNQQLLLLPLLHSIIITW